MADEAPEQKVLDDIDSLKRVIIEQRERFVSDKLLIERLRLELEQLKRKRKCNPSGSSTAQRDERITLLELALEELKSTRPKKEGASRTAVVGLCLSIFGAALAGTTLYLTQFRPPNLKWFIAPSLDVYYQKFTQDGCGPIALYVPVGFINKSARGGTVLRARVFLHRMGDPNTFEKEWTAFGQSIAEGGNIGVAFAGPEGVGPTSVVAKVIQFAWPDPRPENRPPVQPPPAPCPHYPESPEWLEGKYSLELQLWTGDTSFWAGVMSFWTGGASRPISLRSTFSIGQPAAKGLEDRRRNKDNSLSIITFDNQPAATCVSPCKATSSSQPPSAMGTSYVRPKVSKQVSLNAVSQGQHFLS